MNFGMNMQRGVPYAPRASAVQRKRQTEKILRDLRRKQTEHAYRERARDRRGQ